MNFKLTSEFEPTGDQPQAIKQLVEGLRRGDPAQVLLGVTGSGKTFTIANMISQVNRPTLILSHNKTLAAQLYGEFKQFFLKMLLSILFLIMITTNPKHLYPLPIPILKKIFRSMTKLKN